MSISPAPLTPRTPVAAHDVASTAYLMPPRRDVLPSAVALGKRKREASSGASDSSKASSGRVFKFGRFEASDRSESVAFDGSASRSLPIGEPDGIAAVLDKIDRFAAHELLAARNDAHGDIVPARFDSSVSTAGADPRLLRALMARAVRGSNAAQLSGSHPASLAFHVERICDDLEAHDQPLHRQGAQTILRLANLLPVMLSPPRADAVLGARTESRLLRPRWLDAGRAPDPAETLMLRLAFTQVSDDIVANLSHAASLGLAAPLKAEFDERIFRSADPSAPIDAETARRAARGLQSLSEQFIEVPLAALTASGLLERLAATWPNTFLSPSGDTLRTRIHPDGPARMHELRNLLHQVVFDQMQGMAPAAKSGDLLARVDEVHGDIDRLASSKAGPVKTLLSRFVELADQHAVFKDAGVGSQLPQLNDYLQRLDPQTHLAGDGEPGVKHGIQLRGQLAAPTEAASQRARMALTRILRKSFDSKPAADLSLGFYDSARRLVGAVAQLGHPITVGAVRALLARLEDGAEKADPSEIEGRGPVVDKSMDFYWHGGNDQGLPYRMPRSLRLEAFYAMMNRPDRVTAGIVTDAPHRFVAAQLGLQHPRAGTLEPFMAPPVEVSTFDAFVAPDKAAHKVASLLDLAHSFAIERYRNKGVAADVFKVLGPLIRLLKNADSEATVSDLDSAHALSMSNTQMSLTARAETLDAMKRPFVSPGFHGFDQDMVIATGAQAIDDLNVLGFEMAKRVFIGTLSNDFDPDAVHEALDRIIDATPAPLLAGAIMKFLLRQTTMPDEDLLRPDVQRDRQALRVDGAPLPPLQRRSILLQIREEHDMRPVYALTGLSLFQEMQPYTRSSAVHGPAQADELNRVYEHRFGIDPTGQIGSMHDLSWVTGH